MEELEEISCVDENTNVQNWHSITDEQSILINACKYGHRDIIEKYLKDNDVNTVLNTGWTLLLHAASFCNVELVKYLLACRADVKINKDGYTPIMALCNSTDGSTEDWSICLSLLIEASDSVDAIDNFRRTPLMFACRVKNAATVNILLKYVQYIDIQDNDGYTALMYAVLRGDIEIVKLILHYNANPLIKNNYGDTAKDIAKIKEHKEISMLFEEDDHFIVTYTTSRINKWQDLFFKLSSTKDDVVNINIVNVLNSIELHYYINHFQGMDLETFLKLTEQDLINLKMNISIHRDRILKYLNYFHSLPWDHVILKDMIRHYEEPKDVIKIMALMARQIMIMTSTLHFIRLNVDNEYFDDIFTYDTQISEYTEKIKSIEETIVNLKNRLRHLKTFTDKMDVENCLKLPPSYIGPKIVKRSYLKSIIWSMLLVNGIYFIKVKICL